ncbi:RagB/SusD family nutrient uptake outer membrane protein [Tamlana fucoidanivorans]|uniref:RagB/SusD family nutrient uptake outer membrane protein n=1 Tax=Allotamlana fucoidanivorans TaxID=2583814 RepID=A0A5C4SPV9_9FLAO|nr:RagB/SusD family nutrient uptake outer membrane protein [Tamlana fucoidanivorans]TNJ45853.1 RagB/SusD family nutrient uptake outer membrane protein [Tamlana fucoidanivorans]
MRKYIIISLLVMILGLSSSCSGEFDQVVPNTQNEFDDVFKDISRTSTFLNPAYSGVRNTPWISLEYHTNNAVSVNGVQREAAFGGTSESSPVSGEWGSAMNQIFKINEYFKYGFDITYDPLNEERGKALKQRLRGEAFGLRAYYKWVLLKNFAGPSSVDGSMLGIPIIDDLLTFEEVNDVPRSSYMESYQSIKKDLDSAYQYIEVMRYNNGIDDIDGEQHVSRISREMIWALRARLDVFAASPAYNQISWETAAQTAYQAIEAIDGSVLGLQDYGDFNDSKNLDHFWRRSYSNDGDLERAHFPLSLFGRGEANPSQNLIDAFPDINGYPINHPNSIYNGVVPYQNRDGRFERFVFYNGQNEFRNVFIEVFDGGNDANGGMRKKYTRTGYYMKKYLSSNINFDSDQADSDGNDIKVYPIFTRAGLYLDFAEAAVEAYGVNGKDGAMLFSAKDVLRAVRDRAGIQNDQYLDEADDFLNSFIGLIHNERRLEFAFEGEYYYDVRRWMLPVNELSLPVLGVNVIKNSDSSFSYETKVVESRTFLNRMYYNPIPRNEVLKSNVIIQNAGW